MRCRDAVLAALAGSNERRIVGRTMLQKRVNLAGVMCGVELPFQPHYYGPYSHELADAADSLVEYGLVTETIKRGNAERSRLHIYQLDPEAAPVLTAARQRVNQEQPDLWERFTAAVNRIEEIGADYQALSIAAKIHWVLSESDDPLDAAAIHQRIRELDWEFTDEELAAAVGILEELGLAVREPSLPIR